MSQAVREHFPHAELRRVDASPLGGAQPRGNLGVRQAAAQPANRFLAAVLQYGVRTRSQSRAQLTRGLLIIKLSSEYLNMPRSPESPKSRIYEQIARIGKAAASPARLELLDLLSQSPRTVEALATQTGQSVANTSHHLQVLRSARLIEAEKAGVYVTYRLADAQVEPFVLQLRQLAESRLAEIERVMRQYREQRGAMEAIGDDELLKRVRAGEVTVLDVRPDLEYLAGHIAGALSVPLPDLKKRLREIPKNRDVVAYCRGPYCVMALDAVDLLRARGYRAHRLDLGVPEWRARGWRVEEGRVPQEARR